MCRGGKSHELAAPLLPVSGTQATNVNVALRMRPPLRDTSAQCPFFIPSDSCDIVDTMRGVTYTLDAVFDKSKTTKHVFESVVRPIVDSCVEGFNGTIFAYGQTASGKTYTMHGTEAPEEGGIITYSVQYVWNRILSTRSRDYVVALTYLEVYNETLIDLIAATSEAPCGVGSLEGDLTTANTTGKLPTIPLQDKVPAKVTIVERSNGLVELRGATVYEVTSFEQVIALLRRCEKARHVSDTHLNERSSRSHTILSIRIESRDNVLFRSSCEGNEEYEGNRESRGSSLLSTPPSSKVQAPLRVGFLNLVDLAGSEGVSRSQTEGIKRFEGSKINKSLLALTRVISQIVQKQQRTEKDDVVPMHITYRDSKLTRLLSNSLGGNSKTLVICCCSPEIPDYRESVSTLEFASRAKCIRNKARVNLFETRDMLKNDGRQETIHLREDPQPLRLGSLTQKYRSRDGPHEEGKDVELSACPPLAEGRKRPPINNFTSLVGSLNKRKKPSVAMSSVSQIPCRKRLSSACSTSPPLRTEGSRDYVHMDDSSTLVKVLFNRTRCMILASFSSPSCLSDQVICATPPVHAFKRVAPIQLHISSITDSDHQNTLCDKIHGLYKETMVPTVTPTSPTTASTRSTGVTLLSTTIAAPVIEEKLLTGFSMGSRSTFPIALGGRTSVLGSTLSTTDDSCSVSSSATLLTSLPIPLIEKDSASVAMASPMSSSRVSTMDRCADRVLDPAPEPIGDCNLGHTIKSRSSSPSSTPVASSVSSPTVRLPAGSSVVCPSPLASSCEVPSTLSSTTPLHDWLGDEMECTPYVCESMGTAAYDVQPNDAKDFHSLQLIKMVKKQYAFQLQTLKLEHEKRIESLKSQHSSHIQEVVNQKQSELDILKQEHKEDCERVAAVVEQKFMAKLSSVREALIVTRREAQQTLQEKTQKFQEELRCSRCNDCDHIKSTLAEQALMLKNLKEHHEEQLKRVQDAAEEDLRSLQETLVAQHEKDIEQERNRVQCELLQKAQEDLCNIKRQHDSELFTLKTLHANEINNVEERHQDILGALQEEHRQQIRLEIQAAKVQTRQQLEEAHDLADTLTLRIKDMEKDFHCKITANNERQQEMRQQLEILQAVVNQNAFVQEECEFLKVTIEKQTRDSEERYRHLIQQKEENEKTISHLQTLLDEERARAKHDRASLLETAQQDYRKREQYWNEKMALANERISQLEKNCTDTMEQSRIGALTLGDTQDKLLLSQSMYEKQRDDLLLLQDKVSTLLGDIHYKEEQLEECANELSFLRDGRKNDQAYFLKQIQEAQDVARILKDEYWSFFWDMANYEFSSIREWESLVSESLEVNSLATLISVTGSSYMGDVWEHTLATMDMDLVNLERENEVIEREDMHYLLMLSSIRCSRDGMDTTLHVSDVLFQLYSDVAQERTAFGSLAEMSLELCCTTAHLWHRNRTALTAQLDDYRESLRQESESSLAVHKKFEQYREQERCAAETKEQELMQMKEIIKQRTRMTRDACVDTGDLNMFHTTFTQLSTENEQLLLKLHEAEARYTQLLQISKEEKASFEQRLQSTISLAETYKVEAHNTEQQIEAHTSEIDTLKQQIMNDREQSIVLEENVRALQQEMHKWKMKAEQTKEELVDVSKNLSLDSNHVPQNRYTLRSVLKTTKASIP